MDRQESDPRRRNFVSTGLIAGLGGVWLIAVASGFAALLAYSSKPGRSAEAGPRWPRDATVPLASDRPTLVLFAHPRCPCTRATLNELAWLMTHLQGKLAVHVLFVKPEGTDEVWPKTDTWQRAHELAGAEVRLDEHGREAERFHATTSGETFLFDPDGALLFQGGITGARGHEGDNMGRRFVHSLATSGSAEGSRTPVFGCGLGGETR